MNSIKVYRNILVSLGVQLVSLSIGFITGFLVPKLIDELQYSYWQAFIFYIGYVGVFHFGLLDGIVLRYSKYDYDNIDKSIVKSQFKLLFFVSTLVSCCFIICSFFVKDEAIRDILRFLAIGVVTKNYVTYDSYICQITNRIGFYARIILVQRVAYALFVLLFLYLGFNDFRWYCVSDLICDLFVICISFSLNKGLHFGKSSDIKAALLEYKANVSAGIKLMISNLSSLLLVGGAKMAVQSHWGILAFGKISFAISLSHLFLAFINAVAVAVFPSIKRTESYELPKIYSKARGIISICMCSVMLLYYPGSYIVEYFLPAYSISLSFVGILLPMIVFSSVQNLLVNTYLKAYRKEKAMLRSNLLSASIAILLFSLCAYVLDSFYGVLFSLVFAIAFSSILSEAVLTRTINISSVRNNIAEVLLSIGFIAVNIIFPRHIAGCLYFVFVLIYLYIQRRVLSEIVHMIFKR